MADPVTMLERQNLYGTAGEESQAEKPSQGWSSLGSALGGGMDANSQQGYQTGLRYGASTIDALAQAQDRINKNVQSKAAGDFIKQHPELVGGSQDAADYIATGAYSGKGPKDTFDAASEFQRVSARKTLGASFPNSPAQGALAQLDPGSQAEHAVGQAGSFINPLRQQQDPNANPVSVSSQQSDMNQATIDDKQHQADRPYVDPSQKKGLHTGYGWVGDPNDPTGKTTKIGPDGEPMQAPDMNANKGEGAIGERYTRRVVNAQNGLAKEAENLRSIGLDASTEGQVGSGKGVMGTLFENAGKALSSEKSQNYKATMAGIENQLGTIELAGQVPPGTYQKQLSNAVENTGADTLQNRMFHAARLRQISEVAAETASDNPKMSDSARNGIYAATARIQQSVPFTTHEVLQWGKDGKKGESFQEYLDRTPRDQTEQFTPHGNAAPAGGGAAPAAGGQSSGYDPLGLLGKK
jgi:hypothetical protein